MTDPAIQKLRAKEAQIKKRIREIQSRGKSQERRERTARLIRWGVVVEALLKSGEMGAAEWVDACKRNLNARDFEIATAKKLSSSLEEAHINVSPPAGEIRCAPSAGKSE